MKKIIALTIGLIVFIITNMTVFAAEPTFKCEDVNTATSGIYVILEEPLITKSDGDNVICFRVCAKETVGGKRICQIKSTCTDSVTGDYIDSDGKTQNATPTGGTICQRIQVTKAESGTGLLNSYIRLVYIWAAGTIGIIAVFTIVYSGILIIASGGSSDATTKAKERITRSLLGLVILFLSGLILYTINPTFFV